MPTLIPLRGAPPALVSPEDWHELSEFDWHSQWDKVTKSYYALRSSFKRDGRQRNIYMARQIMGLVWGDRRQVDHINHDTLDNRRENLRVVSPSLNQLNSRIRKDNTSGYKGVTWHAKSKRYQVRVRVNGKQIHLGYCQDPKDGAETYRLGLIQQLKDSA